MKQVVQEIITSLSSSSHADDDVLPLLSEDGPIHIPVVKLNEFQLHFSLLSNPSCPEAVLLAFQHTIVMLGTTVMIASFLVPLMGGDHGDRAHVIQTLLFTGGINTLLQTLLGTRLPTVMGASSTFVIPVVSIINHYQDSIFLTEHERFVHILRAIQGALIGSSFFNIILGYSKAWEILTRFLSPVSLIPIISLAGLGKFRKGFPQLGKCMEIGLPMLILLVISQQYLKRLPLGSKHSILEKIGLLFCIGIVWAFAALLTVSGAYDNVSEQTKINCRTDRSYLISAAPWIKIPYPFQWGAPIFKASHIFGMMGAAFVSSAESTGTYYAAARSSGAPPPPAHVLSRSVGLQGIGMLIDGIFGAVVATDASVENVGLLGLTRVGNRRVVQISSGFMIFFSIFGKFGAFFASIPFPIFAAMYCVLFGLVSSTGISYVQFTNSNSPRNLYVLGLSLFLGISVPQYFDDSYASTGRGPVKTAGIWFNDITNLIFTSPPTVVTVVGIVLDNTLDTRGTANDRGLPWFNSFKKNSRKYYGFPKSSGKDSPDDDDNNDHQKPDDDDNNDHQKPPEDKLEDNDHQKPPEDKPEDESEDKPEDNWQGIILPDPCPGNCPGIILPDPCPGNCPGIILPDPSRGNCPGIILPDPGRRNYPSITLPDPCRRNFPYRVVEEEEEEEEYPYIFPRDICVVM